MLAPFGLKGFDRYRTRLLLSKVRRSIARKPWETEMDQLRADALPSCIPALTPLLPHRRFAYRPMEAEVQAADPSEETADIFSEC